MAHTQTHTYINNRETNINNQINMKPKLIQTINDPDWRLKTQTVHFSTEWCSGHPNRMNPKMD